jgi:predicted porin
MRVRAASFASLALLVEPALAAELRSLQVPLEFSLGFGRSSAQAEVMQLQLESSPRLELDVSAAGGLVLEARLRIDGADLLEPGTPALDNYAPASQPFTLDSAGTFELRDVYWEQRLDSGILRLGKQQIVWGRLDGIKVLDVLNPQNFREFIVDDFGDSRISLWSAYLDVFWGAWRVEAALLPDYSAHETPEPGAWFELSAPRFRFGAPSSAPDIPVTTDKDRNVRDDTAMGLRLSRSVGRLDVSAIAYRGNDHEPLARVPGESAKPSLEQFYERRELYGISLETAIGPLALRAETAYQPSKVFNTRDGSGLQTARSDQVSAGIAADVDAPLGFLVNLQFLWDEVLDAPAGLIRPERDRVATVFARRSFAYETARIEARWYHSFDDNDDLYKLTLDYDIGDNTSVFVSGDWFDGTEVGLFGQFAKRDRIVLGVRHTF